jgi:hypothetical protein
MVDVADNAFMCGSLPSWYATKFGSLTSSLTAGEEARGVRVGLRGGPHTRSRGWGALKAQRERASP